MARQKRHPGIVPLLLIASAAGVAPRLATESTAAETTGTLPDLKTIFQSFDLRQPKLAPVRAALDRGDAKSAAEALSRVLRDPERRFTRYHWPWPLVHVKEGKPLRWIPPGKWRTGIEAANKLLADTSQYMASRGKTPRRA